MKQLPCSNFTIGSKIQKAELNWTVTDGSTTPTNNGKRTTSRSGASARLSEFLRASRRWNWLSLSNRHPTTARNITVSIMPSWHHGTRQIVIMQTSEMEKWMVTKWHLL